MTHLSCLYCRCVLFGCVLKRCWECAGSVLGVYGCVHVLHTQTNTHTHSQGELSATWGLLYHLYTHWGTVSIVHHTHTHPTHSTSTSRDVSTQQQQQRQQQEKHQEREQKQHQNQHESSNILAIPPNQTTTPAITKSQQHHAHHHQSISQHITRGEKHPHTQHPQQAQEPQHTEYSTQECSSQLLAYVDPQGILLRPMPQSLATAGRVDVVGQQYGACHDTTMYKGGHAVYKVGRTACKGETMGLRGDGGRRNTVENTTAAVQCKPNGCGNGRVPVQNSVVQGAVVQNAEQRGPQPQGPMSPRTAERHQRDQRTSVR